MHILIVTYGLPSKQNPVSGIFEWDQAKALSNAGVEVDFFAVDLRSFRRFRPWGIKHGEKDGVRWDSISIPVGNIPLPFFCKIGAFALRKLYQNVFGGVSHTPDIIHAHFTENGCMAADVAKEEGIPLIITEHSSAMNKAIISSRLRKIAMYGYNGADCVISVGSSLRDAIYRHTGVLAQVVPNCVSSIFRFERCEHNGFRFISTSNLVSGKRINVLLRAFARLCDCYDDILLEIVGGGEERQRLENLAKDLHISNKVNFHGVMQREKIATLYGICDCFVLPSVSETFGVAYIEAMAAGLPVIATHCGGPEDFVTDKNGIFVDVDDVAGLENAMRLMHDSRARYNSGSISENIRKRFSEETVARELISVYNDVLIKRKDSKGILA